MALSCSSRGSSCMKRATEQRLRSEAWGVVYSGILGNVMLCKANVSLYKQRYTALDGTCNYELKIASRYEKEATKVLCSVWQRVSLILRLHDKRNICIDAHLILPIRAAKAVVVLSKVGTH